MKRLLLHALLLFLSAPAAFGQGTQTTGTVTVPQGTVIMKAHGDTLPFLSGKDSVLKKVPGDLLKSTESQIKTFNPLSQVNTLYSTTKSNVLGAVGQLNPFSKHQAAIRLSNVSGSLSGDYINGPPDSLAFGTTDYSTLNAQINGTLSVYNVPLNLGYQYQILEGGLVSQSYTGTVISFNKQAFTQYLASRLQGKINPADYLPPQFLSIDKMKQQALADMQQDVGKVQQQYGTTLKGGLDLNDWKTLNSADVSTMQHMVVSDSLRKSVSSNQVLLGQLQAKMNNHEPIDTAQYNKIQAQQAQLAGQQHVLNTLLDYRQKWQSSGLTQVIQQMEQEKATAFGNVLKDPAMVSQLARQNLSLNGVEKLFLDMKQLNLGREVNDMSPLTLQQSVFQNGLGTQFLTGSNNAFGLTGGKMPSQASGYEQMFGANAFNNALAMSGLNLGKGNMQGNGSMMTMNTFKSNAMSGLSGMLPFGSGGLQSFVLTFGKSLVVGEHGHVTLEVSKSLSMGSGLSGATDDFFKTLGVSLDYMNEYPKLNLTQQLTFSSSASDYSNPGNAYLLSGMKEASSNLTKTFMNRKLTITLRDSYTSFVTDPTVNSRFVQYNNLLEARWKMKKGNYMALKYQPSWSNNLDSGQHNQVGMIQRLAFELNHNKRLGKHQLHTFTSLAYVYNTFADSILTEPPLAIHSFQLNAMGGLSLKSCQVYLNNTIVYTPQNSAYVYLNSTWTSEGGYMYPINSHLQASSGINYIAVADWYQQVGVKQSLTGSLSSHLTLTLFVDVGKNLAIYQSYPVPTCRGNIMMSYHL